MKNLFKGVVTSVLKAEARLVLKKYKPKIVAVTGSVGKTSTKDAIFTVLSTAYFVRKSSKSFNTEIGVPLTVLGLPNGWNDPKKWLKNIVDGFLLYALPHKYPEWLVFEIGADRPGDISSITSWVKPDVAVITRLSDVPVHVEFFQSPEQVRHEKSQLVRAVGENGFVVLNADDKLVLPMRNISKGKVVTYGYENSADVRAMDYEMLYETKVTGFPIGITYDIVANGQIYPVVLEQVVGRQHMYASIAALAVAQAVGVDMKKASSALRRHETPPGRMKLLAGINGSLIIDDTYNSSPVAAHEALETLREITSVNGGRKIAVLGDMLELGSYSAEQHTKLGTKAAQVAHIIHTVGTRSTETFKTAQAGGFSSENLFSFMDSVHAGESLKNTLGPGDVVLLKASQGIRMEKAIQHILSETEHVEHLLVRQDQEWNDH